jgi:lipopolysaccharide transport system permease protein
MTTLGSALRLPHVLWSHRELLTAFVRRELKARIEGSVLGKLWPVIQPAMLFAIYYLVFAKILKIGFSDDLAPHGEEFKGWRSTFYLITGILPWTVLAEGANRGTGVVLENANLIKKIAFPSELLPTYTTIVFHVYFLVGFVVLLALELFINGGLPITLLWLPLVLLVQFVFVNGLAMFLSAANIFVRDVSQAVPVLVTFWMFTTPVFYDPGLILEQAQVEHTRLSNQLIDAQASGDPNWIRDTEAELVPITDTLGFAELSVEVMSYNPMAVLLDLYRSIFSYGKVPFPAERLFKLGLVAVIVQWLSYAFFLRCKGRFADEV